MGGGCALGWEEGVGVMGKGMGAAGREYGELEEPWLIFMI